MIEQNKETEKSIQKVLLNNIPESFVIHNYYLKGWGEIDFFRVTKAGLTYDYEIKISMQDFYRDKKKNKPSVTKQDMPNYRYYVAPRQIAEKILKVTESDGVICSEPFNVLRKAKKLHNEKISFPRFFQAACVGLFYKWRK